MEFIKNTDESMYRQLYNFFVKEIEEGNLSFNRKMPPRRVIAKQMEVSETTILNAYKLLEDTGYIKSIPRKGYFVTYRSTDVIKTMRWDPLESEQIIFSHNGTDKDSFNRSLYAKIVREIVYNDDFDILYNGEKNGELVLREAIAKYLYLFRNIKCNASQIIIGAGSEYLLLSLAAVLGEDILYAIESPGEMRPYYTLKEYGKNVVTISNNNGLNIEELYKSKANAFYCFPPFHFPDGYVMTGEQKQTLLKWASEEKERYIIEDNRDYEIVRTNSDSLYSQTTQENVIYMGTFSRSLSSAFKISYMVLPESLLKRWRKQYSYYYSLSSKLDQYALAEFINKGLFVKHYKKAQKIYQEKRNYMVNQLEKQFGDRVAISPQSDGTIVIATFDTHISVADIKQRASKSGIKIFNISKYTLAGGADCEPKKFIFGIGHTSKSQIKKGVEILKNIID